MAEVFAAIFSGGILPDFSPHLQPIWLVHIHYIRLGAHNSDADGLLGIFL